MMKVVQVILCTNLCSHLCNLGCAYADCQISHHSTVDVSDPTASAWRLLLTPTTVHSSGL